jgi:dienelactone hydrolase
MRILIIAAVAASIGFLVTTPNAYGAEPTQPIEVIISELRPLPFDLKGYLRRPDGPAQYPAAILVPNCDPLLPSVERFWGNLIASWGYVTLTLDSFGSRRIKADCYLSAPLELARDAHRALRFLGEKTFVDAKRVILVGFGAGGTLPLETVYSDGYARDAKHKFLAAVAFYPHCGRFKGKFAVQTLVIVGELDTWRSADSCHRLAEGRDDFGITRTKGAGQAIELAVVPNARHFFDVKGIEGLIKTPYHLEYNERATEQAVELLSRFVRSAFER